MRTKARLGLLLLGALLVPATVCAHGQGSSAERAGYSVRVENEWGHELPTYHQGGQTYVLGGLGGRYNLRVRNQTGTRVEAVITVDGRDVISGDVGDFTDQRGYLIDAYGEVLIEGFRRSFNEVAAFRFSSPSGSYSARMGTPENVGVIGVAVFPERPRPQPRPQPIARPRPAPKTYSYEGGPRRMAEPSTGNLGSTGPAPASAPAAERTQGAGLGDDGALRAEGRRKSGASGYYEHDYAPPAGPSTDNLGTEYGEAMSSAAREVAFVRANAKRPSAVLTVRYDDEAGLEARGIEVRPRRRPVAQATPDPFPANRRFAQPPPW